MNSDTEIEEFSESSSSSLCASDHMQNDENSETLDGNDKFRYIRPLGFENKNQKKKSSVQMEVDGNSDNDSPDPEQKRSVKNVHHATKDVITGAKIRAFPEGLGPSERRNEWTFLKQQLEFVIRLKPTLKSQQQKLDFLIAEGGREIQKALNSKPAPDEVLNVKDIPVFDNAIKRLNSHFNTGTNAVTDIIRFRNLIQRTNEPFIEFVQRLQQHASFCGFGEAEENEIILQIRQTAINKEKLAEMMTRESKTLQEIVNYGSCLDSEESLRDKKHQTVKEQADRSETVDVAANFSRKPAYRGNREGYRGRGRGFGRGYGRSQRFSPYHDNRGRGHFRQANNYQSDSRTKCYKCGKTGHISRDCYSDTIAYTKEERDEPNVNYNKNTSKDSRFITGFLGGSFKCEFLIDSGANINVIPKQLWDKMCIDEDIFLYEVKMGKTRDISAYGGKQLKVFGSFKAWLEFSNKPRCFEEFVIVEESGIALLSYRSAERLKVLRVGADVNAVLTNQQETFPKVPGLKIKFLINKEVRPVKNSAFRIPASLEAEVERQLSQLEAQGIIEPARYDTPWMSRMDVVIKDKTKWRIVLDMRAVNKAIIRELYPFPTMEKFVTKLSGAKFFTKLDLKSAFHHEELDEESRDMTTFMTPKGPMRFTRLRFGVNCAPEIFQRTMESVFAGCKGVITYIDDVLIFGKTKEELENREKEALTRLANNNLTLNKEKCEFGKSNVEFLGCKLDENGISPSEDKVRAIRNFSPPKNITELKSFIGLVTFISASIKGLAQHLEPLNKLTRNYSQGDWGREQATAFNQIKELMSDGIVTRAFFDVNCLTRIYTDASLTALGAVLVQLQPIEGSNELQERVIACASKTLTNTERRYPQTQKEALAVVWGVEKYSYYLLGREFEIYTDHEPLEFIFVRSKANDRRSLTRAEGWALRFSMYSFKMCHVTSKRNIADPLSRMCEQSDDAFDEDEGHYAIANIETNPDVSNIGENHLMISSEEVLNETESDETLKAVKCSLESDNWPIALRKYELVKDELSIQANMVLRGNRIVLPEALHSRAIEIAHSSHPGISTMKRTLRMRLWWPGMDGQITKKVENCEDCILISKDSPPAPMKRTPLPHNKWDFIAIDFYSAKSPDFTILVVVDYFSRYTRATFVKSTDYTSTTKALSELFELFGRPHKILADNGSPFQSHEFNDWCKQQGIRLIHSTPLWPRQNGMVERFMKNLTRVTSIAKLRNENMKDAVAKLIHDYNRRPHSVTNEAPLKMFLGRENTDQLPSAKIIMGGCFSSDEELDEARFNDEQNKQAGKLAGDTRNRARESSVQPGDNVVVKSQKIAKLNPNFDPRQFTVMSKRGNELKLLDKTGAKLTRNAAHTKKMPHKSNSLLSYSTFI